MVIGIDAALGLDLVVECLDVEIRDAGSHPGLDVLVIRFRQSDVPVFAERLFLNRNFARARVSLFWFFFQNFRNGNRNGIWGNGNRGNRNRGRRILLIVCQITAACTVLFARRRGDVRERAGFRKKQIAARVAVALWREFADEAPALQFLRGPRDRAPRYVRFTGEADLRHGRHPAVERVAEDPIRDLFENHPFHRPQSVPMADAFTGLLAAAIDEQAWNEGF